VALGVWDMSAWKAIRWATYVVLTIGGLFYAYLGASRSEIRWDRSEVSNPAELARELVKAADGPLCPARRVWELLELSERETIAVPGASLWPEVAPSTQLARELANALNRCVGDPSLYEPRYFDDYSRHRPYVKDAIRRRRGAMAEEQVRAANAALLSAVLSPYLVPPRHRRVVREPLVLGSQVIVWLLTAAVAALSLESTVTGGNNLRVQLRATSDQLQKDSKELKGNVEVLGATVNDLTAVLGLEGYVRKAAEIYASEGAARIVTSLGHWVCTGSYASSVEEGLKAARADQIIFVGSIRWDHFIPGVLWRLVTIRELLRDRGRVIHVAKGAPRCCGSTAP
jgi:hypothetical protein